STPFPYTTLVYTHRFGGSGQNDRGRAREAEVIHAVGAVRRRVQHVLHFVAVTHADDVAEPVLDHGQVIQVVVHAIRQPALVTETNDSLLRQVRVRPEHVERDLVDLDECALVRVAAVDIEVD